MLKKRKIISIYIVLWKEEEMKNVTSALRQERTRCVAITTDIYFADRRFFLVFVDDCETNLALLTITLLR